MRRRLLFTAAMLMVPACAAAQAPGPSLKPLYDAVQKLGTDTELRGDIVERLGFGDHPLLIKDLVIIKDGVQHAVNAFTVGEKSYLLFDSHLTAPEIYIFVRDLDGALISGIHGRQYQPITSVVPMMPTDGVLVVGPEETFWRQWLADGAKPPPPAS